MNQPHRTFVENVIALAPIVLLSALLAGLFLYPDRLENAAFEKLVVLVVGFILGNWKEISGWFYGSSKGSAMASQALVEQADKNADRAANVAASVAATAAAKPTLELGEKDLHVDQLNADQLNVKDK